MFKEEIDDGVDYLIRRLDIMGLHRRDTRNFKRIGRKEEIELSEILRNGHSPEEKFAARDALVLGNLGLVQSLARRHLGVEYPDLIQSHYLNLLCDVGEGKYDGRKGSFSTWATFRLRRAAQREKEKSGRTVRVPAHVLNVLPIVSNTQDLLQNKLGRTPSDRELLHELDGEFTSRKLNRRGLKLTENNISRWRSLLQGDQPLEDDFADHRANEDFEEAERNIDLEKAGRIIDGVLGNGVLSDQEKKVANLVYSDGLSRRKAGERMGISGSRVSEVDRGVRKKLSSNEKMQRAYALISENEY